MRVPFPSLSPVCCCFAAVLLLVLATVALAEQSAPEAADKALQTTVLFDLHKNAGLNCADCHGDSLRVDDNETIQNAGCIGCHGSLEEIAARSQEEINPHRSHLGAISCTVCHHGHTPSYAYCLNCHGFELSIPAGAAVTSQLPTDNLPEVQNIPKDIRTEQTDIVVIGAGATGMSAAITAHDLGARVILLEKMPIMGGNSQLAAGGMNAANTRFQAEKGIEDSADLMFTDTMKGGKEENDPALVHILADNSAASVDWLAGLGADLSDVGRMGGASVNRTHRPSGGAAVGAHIAQVLKRNVEERGIDTRLNSRVVKILEDRDGAVTGVLVAGKHSKLYRIEARAVVLAAGGFSANPEQVAYYQPRFKGMTTSNQPGATGDGMEMGKKAGGDLRDMRSIQIHPTVAAGSRILITEAVRGNGAILVNHEGDRFVNEITTRDRVSAAILEQPGASAYLLFDEAIRQSLKQITGYFHLGLVVEGETLAALAEQLKIPPQKLETTVRAYNQAFENKNDAAFQRPDIPKPIKEPRFFAIEVMPGVHYTMGGLKINTETQVIDTSGHPIPGLFAAGEVTGGVHGANRLGGNSISETITFGRIAGERAARAGKAEAKAN